MELVADFVILLMTVVGATSTISAEHLLKTTSPLMLLFLRFSIAALVLFLIKPKDILRSLKGSLPGGLAVGGGFGFGCLFLYLGLPHVHTGHAMFLISMEVILVPVFGYLLFKESPTKLEFASFFIALVGLSIFTNPQNGSFSVYDLLILTSACCYATYTISLSHFSSEKFYFGQIFVTYIFIATVSGIAALMTNSATLPSWNKIDLSVFAYFILVSTLIRFLGQSWAQRIASPTRTALIFLMEPIFALLMSNYFYGELFPQEKIIGGAIIFAASLLATIGIKKNVAIEV